MNSLADESIEAKTVEMEPLYHRVYSPWLAQLGENSSSVRPAQRQQILMLQHENREELQSRLEHTSDHNQHNIFVLPIFFRLPR
jgi:hypothetical protein